VAEKALDPVRARVAALETRLDAPAVGRELDTLKSEIGVLYLALEHDIAELTALRDRAKGLIDRWKALKQGKPAAAPQQGNGAKPGIYADHLGASTFIEKGWSKISLADYEGAEETLRKALELSPNDAQAESLLGWSLMLQEHKLDDALKIFQKVIARDPHNALARANLGYICLKKRIFGEAIEHLARAIRLDNDKRATLYAHFYLGLVYLERQMFEDAETFFEKTIVLGPGLIEAHYELGRACWLRGHRDKAIQTWTAGRDANTLSPWSRRCGEMLVKVMGEMA
jgi:tetratricopeptide (TPR) repeat protein